MINVSNEYKQAIRESGKKQYGGAIITLANGTILTLNNSNIMENGIGIKDGTTASNSFQIGSAIINELTIIIDNRKGEFSNYDFTDAVIRPTIGLQLSATIETLNKGVFTVDESKAIGGIISITALDNMNKFDMPFSNVTAAFPITTFNLLYATCLHSGVSLATVDFLNKDFLITRRPDDEAITCREIVAWIAQLSGNFARCNTDGALELKWYDIGAFESSDNLDGGTFDNSTPYATGDIADGGTFTDYNSGDYFDGGTFLQLDRYHHIYSLSGATIGTDDVIITGIQVKAMGTETDYGETVLFGSNGYVIEITDNPLIQEGNASTIANSVGAKIVGMRFRTCSVTATADPSREAGDVAYLSYKNNSYQILLTNLAYTIGAYDNITCDAETPSKKQSVRFSPQTKAIVEARKVAKQEISTYDLAVQQFTNLMSFGFGLYKTEELQENGSTIYYMHDKPTIAESDAVWKFGENGLLLSSDHGITWGVDANGNMLVNVLTAIGINAEWIKVLTSFTVGANFSVNAIGELIAKAGQIGPFTLNDNGLFSNQMEFYDDGVYPLIWLSKPGTSGGTFETEADGSARANYEPSVTAVRSIESGVLTEITTMARTDPSKGKSGLVTIRKVNLSSYLLISEIEINQDGFNITRYDSSGNTESIMTLQNNMLAMNNPSTGKAVFFTVDPSTGDVSIQSQGKINLQAPGGVFVNGVAQ